MGRRGAERPLNLPDGKPILDITVGIVRNVLEAIDKGVTTDEIRASLDRIDKSEAIQGDARYFIPEYFVLGISQKSGEPENTA